MEDQQDNVKTNKSLIVSILGIVLVVLLLIVFLFDRNSSTNVQDVKKETGEGLIGADSNGNGVWDYIDVYIQTEFPNQNNLKVRQAARQYARAIQNGMLNAEDKELSQQYASDSDRATECMYFHRPEDAYDILSELDAVILNNRTRSLAFLTYSEQSARGVFKSVPSSERRFSCIEDSE